MIAQGDQDAARGPVGLVTGWSSDLSNWLNGFDPVQVALAFALVISGVVLAVLLRSGGGSTSDPTSDSA